MVGVTIFIFALVASMFIGVHFGYKEKWKIVLRLICIELIASGSFAFISKFGVEGGWL